MFLIILLGGLVLLSGCSGCSGKLSPEAERAMKGGRYSMEERASKASDEVGDLTDEPENTVEDEEKVGAAETEDGAGVQKTAALTGGNGLEVPARLTNLPEQILRRKAYVVSFNTQTLMPNWVAWQLTREETYGRVKRNGVKFQEDYDVDSRYRVNTFDYNLSGYDRGHMCPAGDNKWGSEAMQECFLMTNMCPQLHSLNSGAWNDVEMLCRTWARRYGEIYIVCGPIVSKTSTRKIGKRHKITVPTGFFKVVLCMDETPKAIGFVFKNVDGRRTRSEYMNSVDDVERITGIDFFPTLPDDVENRVEAHADLDVW